MVLCSPFISLTIPRSHRVLALYLPNVSLNPQVLPGASRTGFGASKWNIEDGPPPSLGGNVDRSTSDNASGGFASMFPPMSASADDDACDSEDEEDDGEDNLTDLPGTPLALEAEKPYTEQWDSREIRCQIGAAMALSGA